MTWDGLAEGKGGEEWENYIVISNFKKKQQKALAALARALVSVPGIHMVPYSHLWVQFGCRAGLLVVQIYTCKQALMHIK